MGRRFSLRNRIKEKTMTRKFRLISSNNVEIAVTGLNSLFLDTLLTDHPHKVATISIPFTANTVLEFVKTTTNQERAINRDVANKVVSIYKLLGIDIELNDNSQSEEEIEDSFLDNNDNSTNENGEPKYLIKIEIEHRSSTEIDSMAESSVEVDSHPLSPLENEPSSPSIESDMSHSNVDLVRTSSTNHEIVEDSQNIQPTHVIPESDKTGEVLDFHENTEVSDAVQSRNRFEINPDLQLESSIEDASEKEIGDYQDNLVNEGFENISNLDIDCTLEDIDVDFSFHDMEEELSPQTDFSSEPLRQTISLENPINNCSKEVDPVISKNIINQAYSQSPKTPTVEHRTQTDVCQPLKLQFIYKNVPLIKNITKKKKRKRGQN